MAAGFSLEKKKKVECLSPHNGRECEAGRTLLISFCLFMIYHNSESSLLLIVQNLCITPSHLSVI